MTNRPRILLVASNGAGMGHLTRQAAVALSASKADPTLFSLSVALPVTRPLGLEGEYCPSAEREWMPVGHWHGYLRDRLIALVRELVIDVVAFDGVAPYPGIGQAKQRLPDVAFVWVRRGMWRPGANMAQLKKRAFFDYVVEPCDLASRADRGATATLDDAHRIPPISMRDAVDLLPRREAATQLGIDPDRPTALVTLGSGRLGDVAAPGAVVLDELLMHTDWQICVTKPAVALKEVPIVDRDRVVELSGVYPLASFLAAFDAAVSAAGYNSVHEFIPAAIPTMLVPNPATTTDDQVARAQQLAVDQLAVTALPNDEAALRRGVATLIDQQARTALADACRSLPNGETSGGAPAAAAFLTDLAQTHEPTSRGLRDTAAMTALRVREATKGVLGPERSDMVRKALGREPIHGRTTKLPVVIVDDNAAGAAEGPRPLLFSDAVPRDRIISGDPVEDLLPGTSAAYHKQRLRIVAEYYDVTGTTLGRAGSSG